MVAELSRAYAASHTQLSRTQREQLQCVLGEAQQRSETDRQL